MVIYLEGELRPVDGISIAQWSLVSIGGLHTQPMSISMYSWISVKTRSNLLSPRDPIALFIYCLPCLLMPIASLIALVFGNNQSSCQRYNDGSSTYSIYYTGELTTSYKWSKVWGCVVLIANKNSLNAYIVTTKPMILINIRKLHQQALTELRQGQHQSIYKTKKMIWWTHVETTDMATTLICKSQELQLD